MESGGGGGGGVERVEGEGVKRGGGEGRREGSWRDFTMQLPKGWLLYRNIASSWKHSTTYLA